MTLLAELPQPHSLLVECLRCFADGLVVPSKLWHTYYLPRVVLRLLLCLATLVQDLGLEQAVGCQRVSRVPLVHVSSILRDLLMAAALLELLLLLELVHQHLMLLLQHLVLESVCWLDSTTRLALKILLLVHLRKDLLGCNDLVHSSVHRSG